MLILNEDYIIPPTKCCSFAITSMHICRIFAQAGSFILHSKKNCAVGHSLLYLLKCLVKLEAIMCSMDLHIIHVREICQ